MANIKIKRGSGVPSGLTFGELAFDTTNKKLYIGLTAGAELLTSPQGGVSSVNGATGAITNVARTNVSNLFTANQFISTPNAALRIYDSSSLNEVEFQAEFNRLYFYNDLLSGEVYFQPTIPSLTTITVSLPGYDTTLAGLAGTQTFTGTNTFNARTNFPGGISAAGATLSRFTTIPSGSTLNILGNITGNIVASVNGATGAVTNIAVTNTAQSFTGVQRFPSGFTASGFTLTDGANTATYLPTAMSFAGGASLVIDAPAVDFVSTGAIGFGDVTLVANQTKMYLDDTSRRLYLNTSSGNNAFFNINRVINTTSALLVNHTTGKTVRLVYNTPTGAITNYADLDVSSSGDLLITPNGGDTVITGNVHIVGVGGLTAAGATFTGPVTSDGGFRITSNAINAQTGTTYTFLTTDNGKIVTFSNSSATTVTIPTGLPVGFNCTAIQLGSGQVGFTAASGVTLQSYGNQLRLIGQHASATVIEYSTNIVNLSGNLII